MMICFQMTKTLDQINTILCMILHPVHCVRSDNETEKLKENQDSFILIDRNYLFTIFGGSNIVAGKSVGVEEIVE